MVQDEIQRVQKEEKQTEKRIKNIIFNNKKNKNAILTVNKLHFISILWLSARLNNNINLTRCHEKENDYYIFKYKHIATIFFMFNYTRNYNRR